MDGVGIFVLSTVLTVLFFVYQYIPATNSYRTILQEQKQPMETVKAKRQFITLGKWMPGRKHNQSCEFLHKPYICCKMEQSLHFEFYNKRLNKVDAVEEFRIKLRNKKILIIGDSLTKEFFAGLVALLQRKNTSKYRERVLTSKKCGKTMETLTSCTFLLKELVTPSNNSTITGLTAYTIWLESERNFSVRSKFSPTPEKMVRRQISNHDIVFINQGLHYGRMQLHRTKEEYFYRIGQMLYSKDFMVVLHNKYVSLQLSMQNAVSAQPCVGKL